MPTALTSHSWDTLGMFLLMSLWAWVCSLHLEFASWEFPGDLMVRTPGFHCQAWVQSLVRKLRSCKTRIGQKKKKRGTCSSLSDIYMGKLSFFRTGLLHHFLKQGFLDHTSKIFKLFPQIPNCLPSLFFPLALINYHTIKFTYLFIIYSIKI